MPRNERTCQIRMSSSLWDLVGELAQEQGSKDARGRHSAVIREMVAATAAKWRHSPYVCRSARHTVYVTREGNIFSRQVEILRLNSPREKLPCFVEMKPEKRESYHRTYRESEPRPETGEYEWFKEQWLLNYFAVWNGKKSADHLQDFEPPPLGSYVDTVGTTYKNADLAVHALSGRFLTREITLGLHDYVQWKEPKTPVFDRFDIPIDIPTSELEVCVVVDLDLFAFTDIPEDEIANLALEFRNRESARFEGKEVALLPEISIQERFGRASDEGADEMLNRVRRLKQRATAILERDAAAGKQVSEAARAEIASSLKLPQRFLFYWLRWPAPHLGIEVCVRWEKPVKREASGLEVNTQTIE